MRDNSKFYIFVYMCIKINYIELKRSYELEHEIIN